MPTMHACEPVDSDYLRIAAHRFSNSVELDVRPARVFDIFTDADAWPRWASVITAVEWTSEPPYGVGTTRTVRMLGGLVGEEEFLEWEPGRRMAFRFNACSLRSIRAFAEGYDLEETAQGCKLTWTLAMHGTAATNASIRVFTPLMNLAFRHFLGNLRKIAQE